MGDITSERTKALLLGGAGWFIYIEERKIRELVSLGIEGLSEGHTHLPTDWERSFYVGWLCGVSRVTEQVRAFPSCSYPQ